jgi:hypothetical protein
MLLEMLVNNLPRLVPTAVIPRIIATATRAAINPYSIAVTPLSDFTVRRKRLIIRNNGMTGSI